MRILFVIPTLRMGGAEKSLCNLLNKMVDEDDDISLLVFSNEGDLKNSVPQNVTVYSLSAPERAVVLEWRYYYKDLIHSLSVQKLTRRSIVLVLDHIQRFFHIQAVDSWRILKPALSRFPGSYDLAIGFLEGTADFYALEKVTAKKKVGWVHTDFSRNKKNIIRERKYYRKFDRIATITETCKTALIEQMPEIGDKVDVVPNISDNHYIEMQSKEFSPFRDNDEVYHIVSVGRLEDEKGIDIAIEAAAVLVRKKLPFIWHVYGDGRKKEQLTRLIHEKGLTDIFLLEGVVKNPYPYIRCCDVIVQPSRYEGKSVVLDEAKILCKPIVVTAYATARDQIVSGKTGIICDFKPSEIANAIVDICTNKTLARHLSEECKTENEIRDDGYRAFTEFVKRVNV